MKLSAGARRRYGVVVVGSGPAGVSAAWPLVEAGLDVAMVDASDPAPLPSPVTGTIGSLRADPAQWRHRFGADLGGSAAEPDISPKFATPLARALTASYQPTLGLQSRHFWAAGSLSQGGLSNIWGAVAETYDDADLAGYPLAASDLAPSYHAVMARAGITDDPLPVREAPGFVSPVQEIFRRRGALQAASGFALKPARNAILAEAKDGRQACHQCGLCLWGCANRSIYSSAYEIPALQRFANFTYIPHARVVSLSDADGLQGLQMEQHGARLNLAADRIVLAAGTIATTALVLARLGMTDTPVRLLTNPVGAIAFVLPKLIGQDLPGHSFSLGQLSYTMPIGGPAGGTSDYAAGIFYGADTLPLGVIADRMPLSRPVALRAARALMPALVLATCYVPGRFSRNTMRLEQGRVVVEGERTQDSDRAILGSARAMARQMRRVGAYAVPGSLTLSQPGSDAHYAGTLPMGGQGPSACDRHGTLNGCKGITVADGAALSALPAKHCTLTIMANADRIARFLVKTMQGAIAP